MYLEYGNGTWTRLWELKDKSSLQLAIYCTCGLWPSWIFLAPGLDFKHFGIYTAPVCHACYIFNSFPEDKTFSLSRTEVHICSVLICILQILQASFYQNMPTWSLAARSAKVHYRPSKYKDWIRLSHSPSWT